MRTALLILLALSCRVLAFTALDGAKTMVSDGSHADMQDAANYIAGKAEDGWVWTFGSAGGSTTHVEPLVITVAHTLTIQGASSSNRPTITFGPSFVGSWGIAITTGASKLVTFKDAILAISYTAFPTGVPTNGVITVNGSGVCFRISNCSFPANSQQDVFKIFIGSINGTHTAGPYGLIDHCTGFAEAGANAIGQVFANGSADHYGWSLPMTWGTQEAVYFEDCDFSAVTSVLGHALVDGFGGARVVVRHNNIRNYMTGFHGRQSGANDGILQVEFYENDVLCDSGVDISFLFWMRGGTATCFNNRFTNTVTQQPSAGVFRFTTECASTSWAEEQCARQLAYPADYPDSQQIGRGVVGGVEGSVPCYLWNNTMQYTGLYGDSAGVLFGIGGDGNFQQLNVEIFEGTPRPGYTPLTYPHPLRTAEAPAPGSTSLSGAGSVTVGGAGSVTVGP